MMQLDSLPRLDERDREPIWRRYLIDSLLGISGALLVTLLIYLFHLYPSIPNISLTYLLVVLALASTRSLYSAILASFAAFASFDFFLVDPLFTFTILKFEEWLALFVFLATAVITGELAAALRKRAEQASRREREARILYELVRATNREENLERQLTIIADAMVSVFAPLGVKDCMILLQGPDGKPSIQVGTSGLHEQKKLTADEEATVAWVIKQGQTVELHDVSLSTQQQTSRYAPRAVVRSTVGLLSTRRYVRLYPLQTGNQVIGVMRLLIEDDPRFLGDSKGLGAEGPREQTNPRTAFFWTFLDQATSVIERARLRREAMQVELLQRTDALRAALLSSVSHDLRTPLSSIKASASSLLQEDVQWSEEERRSFAATIERQSDRLNRLVGNLLDMSRIEGGAVKPEKEWYPIGELIYDVLDRMRPQLQGREVKVDIPDQLPPVELDYLQIDQVLTNLIENALRYTPQESPIEVRAWVNGSDMLVSVADRGPGVPVDDLERIFDKFYRVSETPRRVAQIIGSGLGLAVCRGLVEAHGGKIWAENREGGGAIFQFTLPLAAVSSPRITAITSGEQKE